MRAAAGGSQRHCWPSPSYPAYCKAGEAPVVWIGGGGMLIAALKKPAGQRRLAGGTLEGGVLTPRTPGTRRQGCPTPLFPARAPPCARLDFVPAVLVAVGEPAARRNRRRDRAAVGRLVPVVLAANQPAVCSRACGMFHLRFV